MMPDREVVNGMTFACCRVCGIDEVDPAMHDFQRPDLFRCDRHLDRNPCVIDGCKRSFAAPNGQLSLEIHICAKHWKRFCPPRSARRRAYHSFFRKAKKLEDWTPELRADFWSFWDQLVRSARARHAAGAEGHIDVDQINKMFGLDG